MILQYNSKNDYILIGNAHQTDKSTVNALKPNYSLDKAT